MKRAPTARAQGGFAYIAAVILLVLMAGMALAVVRLNLSQANAATGAALTARASQAARAGLEWAFYQLGTRNTNGCAANTDLTDFQKDTGFTVSVHCTYKRYNEGQDPANGNPVVKNLYQVEAVACNGSSGSCPADDTGSAQVDYTERRRVATVCMLDQKDASGSDDCY
jgi:MSHA biogenesis protein MshP